MADGSGFVLTHEYQTAASSTASELEHLRPEWDALFTEAEGMAAQSPAYVLTALRTLKPGAAILAVTVRRYGRLVGVLPLMVTTRGSVRVAVQPGCGSCEEYADALIAPWEDAARIAELAIQEARLHADVLTLHNVPVGAPIAAALQLGRSPSVCWPVTAFVVGLQGGAKWEGWLKSKSKNFRQNLGGQRRNLAKLGELVSVQDEPDIIPWFFAAKREWLKQSGKRSAWIENTGAGEAFFLALAQQSGGPLKTFALRLNGAYIAAGLCLVSRGRLEYYATAYSPGDGIDRYSPGMLISEDCGRWALDQGLDLDFRMLEVPYKRRWVSRTDSFASVMAALNPRGAPQVRLAALRLFPSKVRRRLGRIARVALRVLRSRIPPVSTAQPARRRRPISPSPWPARWPRADRPGGR